MMISRKSRRAAQGAGTIRQRADGRWEARYTIGRDGGSGKQIQKSVYGKSQKEVRQRLQQINVSIDDGTYIQPSKLSVSEWLNIWKKEYLGNVKEHTTSQYNTQINVHLIPIIGALKLSALNTHMIQCMYNSLARGEKNNRPLSAKSIRNLHGVLHKALQQAVTLGYIKFNPSDACTLPRIEKTEIQPIEDEKIKELLSIIQGHKYETLYLIDLFTGMRLGEIIGLTWNCVDFKKGILTVNKQLQRERIKGGEYRFVSLKNDKTRRIVPAKAVMTALAIQRQKQIEWKLKIGSLWDNSLNLVFTNEFGKHLAAHTVYMNFKRLAASIGIPETRFHDLRHTFAMLSLQNGDDVKTVQENLGHATASFTLDKYGHVSERMKRDSADRMEGYIKGISGL